jgi:hypothetical protein
MDPKRSFPGSIVVAFIGAVVLIGLLRTLSGGSWGLGNS